MVCSMGTPLRYLTGSVTLCKGEREAMLVQVEDTHAGVMGPWLREKGYNIGSESFFSKLDDAVVDAALVEVSAAVRQAMQQFRREGSRAAWGAWVMALRALYTCQTVWAAHFRLGAGDGNGPTTGTAE